MNKVLNFLNNLYLVIKSNIKPIELTLRPVGYVTHKTKGKEVIGNYYNYFLTQDNKLFTGNIHTHFTRYGRDLRKCSDDCIDASGNRVNSLRSHNKSTTSGKNYKLTATRSRLVKEAKFNAPITINVVYKLNGDMRAVNTAIDYVIA